MILHIYLMEKHIFPSLRRDEQFHSFEPCKKDNYSIYRSRFFLHPSLLECLCSCGHTSLSVVEHLSGPVVQSSLACHAFSGEIELIGMGTPNQGTGLVEIPTNPDFSRLSVVELK